MVLVKYRRLDWTWWHQVDASTNDGFDTADRLKYNKWKPICLNNDFLHNQLRTYLLTLHLDPFLASTANKTKVSVNETKSWFKFYLGSKFSNKISNRLLAIWVQSKAWKASFQEKYKRILCDEVFEKDSNLFPWFWSKSVTVDLSCLP